MTRLPAARRPGLLYHAGGLGDFVLSLPAVLRVAAARPLLAWHFWGPLDRLALLPGFAPAPPVLRRSGHTLWGAAPAPEAAGWLGGAGAVLAFGGREPPAWAGGPGCLPACSFPPPEGPRVPAFQARQLDALGVPRPAEPLLPAWRRAVLPAREPAEVVLHPGSGDPKKNLPAATWAEALALLRRRAGLPVRVILGPAEQERGGWEALAGEGEVSACDDLPTLLAALGRAALFLGNDSGAAHLAALLGIPTVAAFAPSDPTLWRPLGPRVAVVRAAAACAPCTAGGAIACPAPACAASLPASALAEAAEVLLSR